MRPAIALSPRSKQSEAHRKWTDDGVFSYGEFVRVEQRCYTHAVWLSPRSKQSEAHRKRTDDGVFSYGEFVRVEQRCYAPLIGESER